MILFPFYACASYIILTMILFYVYRVNINYTITKFLHIEKLYTFYVGKQK